MAARIDQHFFTARTGPGVRVADLAIAAAAGALWWTPLSRGSDVGPGELALLVASSAAVGLWRLAPLPLVAVSGLCAAGLALGGAITWPPVAPVLGLYLAAASTAADRRSRLGSVGLALLVGGTDLAAVTASGSWEATDLGHATLAFAVGWFAGDRTRLRREQIAALHERVHEAAAANARESRLAVMEERSRIARDLHDSAGHALSVIAVRAGGAQLTNDPERAFAALRDIAGLARETTADIDHMVTSLREGEDAPRSPIGLASADTVIEQHRAAGMTITTTYDGELPQLGSAADQAAFRGLQEALTNAARHGSGSAEVTFSGADGRFCLTVANPVPATVPPTPPDAPPAPAGHGLIGMRERVSMLGGTVSVERLPGRFVLRLTLPAGGAAA